METVIEFKDKFQETALGVSKKAAGGVFSFVKNKWGIVGILGLVGFIVFLVFYLLGWLVGLAIKVALIVLPIIAIVFFVIAKIKSLRKKSGLCE